MDSSPVKLAVHHHSLYHSSRFLQARCHSCKVEGPIHGGYRCNDYECDHIWFHKECAESPPQINHPSHPDHLLQLTQYFPKTSHRCDLCGTNQLDFGYHCSICNFNLDTRCARSLSYKVSVEYSTSHDHPLVLFKDVKLTHPCEACKNTINGRYPYGCVQCNVYFHVECIDLSIEVIHPCHVKHHLDFVESESLPRNAEKICVLCGEALPNILHRCSICNFSICLHCVRNPPPLSIEHFKTHKHKLTLLSRQISFTCNLCGMQGDRSPYLCLDQCGFMIHRGCIDLPRVININRYNHRISFTPHIGIGSLECPICRQGINRYCGAYFNVFKDYIVHSHCATRDDVWDGIELEGLPEDTEDLSPFKEVGDGLIIHFLHANHTLKLEKDNTIINKSTRCEVCVSPVYSEPVYNCESCDFTLHETCANFPRKKRQMFHRRPFTLQGCNSTVDSMKNSWFQCYTCGIMSSGFRYKSFDGWYIDVICSLFSEPFKLHDPLHPLYLTTKVGSTCVACGKVIEGMVLCSDNGAFVLDMRCANLPKKVKHICDRHFLSLSYGEEEASGRYWCDICERETDPSKWFYTCSDCGVTLHVDCVVGDFSHIKPGCVYEYEGQSFSVVPNNRSSRPVCDGCGSRCKVPFILKGFEPFIKYFCSLPCSLKKMKLCSF